MRKDDFMANKCQMYVDTLVMNSIDVKCLYDISVDFWGIAKRYNAQVIMCAYNAKFDYEVLNNNLHMYEGDDVYFFDNVDNVIDIIDETLATAKANEKTEVNDDDMKKTASRQHNIIVI